NGNNNNMKRYLILTYLVEFDRVHYPLPLAYQTNAQHDPQHLRQVITRLYTYATSLQQEFHQQTNTTSEHNNNNHAVLIQENSALKSKVLPDCYYLFLSVSSVIIYLVMNNRINCWKMKYAG